MTSVGIVGAGTVGSTVAYTLATTTDWSLTLIDVDGDAARGHALDVDHARNYAGHPVESPTGGPGVTPTGSVTATEPGALDEAFDLVLVCASAPRPENSAGRGGREAFLDRNRAVMSDVASALASHPEVPVVVVTNPVDRMVHHLWTALGWDRSRFVGFALSESARAAHRIGEIVGVPPAAVRCPILGEHGEHIVPVYSRTTAGGEPVDLDAEQRRDVEEYVRAVPYEIIDLRGEAETSRWVTGYGVSRLAQRIVAGGEGEPVCLSTPVRGAYGIEDVSLSVPVELDETGVSRIVEWELTEDESEKLTEAARAIATDLG